MGANNQSSNVWSDKFIERVECLRRDLRQVQERWNNRLVLEDSPFGELYLNGRAEILLYGNWRVGSDKIAWAVRIARDREVIERARPGFEIDVVNCCDGNDWQEVVVFVPVAETCYGPEIEVISSARLYIIEDEVCKVGEGLLYRDITSASFKVFPFRFEREIGLLPSFSDGNKGRCYPIIHGLTHIVDCIPDNAAKMLRDWLFGSIGEIKTIRVYQQGVASAPFDPNLIKVFGQGGRLLDKRINVAVGPFDL